MITDFDTALMRAEEKFKKQFDNWAFDERDDLEDNLQSLIEEILGRRMTEEECKDEEFLEAKIRTIELEKAADNVSYQNRVGSKVDVAIAEEKFQRLK